MRKIYKYPIEPKDSVQTIDLPVGAEIVAMREQTIAIKDPEKLIFDVLLGGKEAGIPQTSKLSFWAIVDPKQEKTVPRRLMCVGTGWEVQPNIEDHIDTCVTEQGFVWHLLEVK
jgi:hypothetical protein